jgi:hypothetical protein
LKRIPWSVRKAAAWEIRVRRRLSSVSGIFPEVIDSTLMEILSGESGEGNQSSKADFI